MRYSWLLFPLLSVSLCCCTTDKKVVGSGHLVIKERPTEPFTAIVLNSGAADLVVKQGNKEFIEVESDDNVVELFTSVVKDGVLTLDQSSGYAVTTAKDIVFHVTVKNVESLTLAGNGNLRSEGRLRIDDLTVVLAGSGNVDLDVKGKHLNLISLGSGDLSVIGDVESQKVVLKGSSDYNGGGLTSKEAAVIIYGSGSASVDARNKLSVDIHGSGRVKYKGHPKVEQTIEGTGSVHAAD